MKKKYRLDQRVQELFPDLMLSQVQSWIMQGKVFVDDKVVNKAGTQVTEDAKVELRAEEPKYVSRAGYKLEKALEHFNIDVKDYIVLDAGISTGGFTDCLLQKGAKKIFGVDVDYGEVHNKIRIDPRVVLFERTNLRYLDPKELGEKVDLATLDLSFISVLKVMDIIKEILKDNGKLIVLIKPQFEAKKSQVGIGGIIKDSNVHEEVKDRITKSIEKMGFKLIGVIDSPIKGRFGNKEFLAYFERILD